MSRRHRKSHSSNAGSAAAAVADCASASSSAGCAGTECCGEPSPHEQIAARAHEIWETRGRPEGQDLDIWLAAEVEVRSRNG